MKKYIFLFILIGLTSCSNEIKKVENPKKETTIEILDLPRDTSVIVVINQDIVYLLNKDSKLVQYKLEQVDDLVDDLKLTFAFIIFLVCGLLIGILIK